MAGYPKQTIRRTVLTIFPVFEAPWYEGKPQWPWQIADVEAFSFIPIKGDSDDAIIGSFFASFVREFDLSDEKAAVVQLEDILESGALSCDGGLMFQSSGVTISPGCCSNLGEVNEWGRFLVYGEKPWTGHDPSPWAVWDGDNLVIWSDGGPYDQSVEPCIRTTRGEFENQLKAASRILTQFGVLCGEWLVKNKIPRAKEIHARIMTDFRFNLHDLDSDM